MATRVLSVHLKSQTNARFRKTCRTLARQGSLDVCVRGNNKTGYTVSAICGVRLVKSPGNGLARYQKPANVLGLADLSDTYKNKSDAQDWLSRKIGVAAVAMPTGKLVIVGQQAAAA